MNHEQLRALAAIIDEGSFEAAADLLGISPSAVSQRIKALENSVGHVVVRRRMPCRPTEAGEVLLRMARQVQALESETRRALGSGPAAPAATPVAVNADSLATWFVEVLGKVAERPQTTLQLHVEDQDHSSALLRQGDVVGAVTADPDPVNGCFARPLGFMRYVPVATPGLHRRHGSGGALDWAAMPLVQYNAKDDLQRRVLREHGIGATPPTHTVPSTEGFLAAVKSGLGWGMVPELQLATSIADGSLVRLGAAVHLDVPLYWQAWKLRSERLDFITRAVEEASRRHLGGGPTTDRASRPDPERGRPTQPA